ncbi:MAG: energy-coupling factor transporter transmembrane component T [Dorea sp.]
MYIRPYTRFSILHPSLLLLYALGTPVLAMFGKNPCFLLLMFLCAVMVHWFYFGKTATCEGIKGISAFVILVVIFNMLTNSMGITEIFKIGSRSFTIESLCYGIANGLMLGSVILWFRCFTAILPNDKFLYLFGKRFPTTALLLSMILKLFPETKYKIHCIKLAQNSDIGDTKRSLKMRLRKSMRQISSLLEWSMEDGIETADSMRARGYGEGNRSSYHKYQFTRYDVGMLIYFLSGLSLTTAAILEQSQSFLYYPTIVWNINNKVLLLIEVMLLVVFLLTPIWLEYLSCRKFSK